MVERGLSNSPHSQPGWGGCSLLNGTQLHSPTRGCILGAQTDEFGLGSRQRHLGNESFSLWANVTLRASGAFRLCPTPGSCGGWGWQEWKPLKPGGFSCLRKGGEAKSAVRSGLDESTCGFRPNVQRHLVFCEPFCTSAALLMSSGAVFPRLLSLKGTKKCERTPL